MNSSLDNRPKLLHLGNQSVFALDAVTLIGRHEDCNLVLNTERGASRKHARITVEDGRCTLLDLGSLNGTTVNSREITSAVELNDTDIIIFDEQAYQYVAPTKQDVQFNADNLFEDDNVTVVANPDSTGHREASTSSTEIMSNQTPSQDAFVNSLDDTEAWEIAATSRPGGDNPTPKHIAAKQHKAHSVQQNTSWFSWVVLVPLAILIALIGLYLAYTTGLTTGLSGSLPSPSK